MQRTVLVTSGGLSLYSKYIKIGRKKGGFQPGGGYFRNFWVGMCRWDPGTLNLYQS